MIAWLPGYKLKSNGVCFATPDYKNAMTSRRFLSRFAQSIIVLTGLPHLCKLRQWVCVYREPANINKYFFLRILSFSFFLTISLLIFSPITLANNLTIENVELADQNASADTIVIEFDISWNNSWKDSTNNDAAWVFAKYCTSNCSTNGTWNHATLKTAGTNPTGFSDGTKQSGSVFSSMDLIVPDDKNGCFIQPQNNGSGTIDFHDVQIIWDYGQDGLSDAEADGANTRVEIFAIEMVFITQGGFYAGDGNSGGNGELEYGGGNSSEPGAINSEEGVSFANAATAWFYNSDSSGDDDASGSEFQVSESFPKGFQAFYVMKYEMSQGQYRDFLNKLSQAEQNTRVASDLSNENDANTYVMIAEGQGTVSDRQVIKAGSNPSDGDPYTFGCDLGDNDTLDESSDGEWIAMNYLSWMDLLAYADWSGLRPMTEFEFEKISRGTLSAITDEYAWGSTDLTDADTISSSGQAGEGVTETGNGLCNYGNDGVTGPLRVGFAATASTDVRKESGASILGLLELSGNLWERTVTLGNATGRGFSGSHGDGVLSTTSSYVGNATNIDWPGIDSTDESRGVTGALGGGFRGGAWDETTTAYLTISNRDYAGDDDSTRRSDSGGRVVRTSP